MSSPKPTPPAPAFDAVIHFFEHLQPADLPRLDELYSEDAYFKDPFNEVRGRPAIRRIFEHMFVQVHEPRFVIRDRVGGGDEIFLTWDFEFRRRPGAPAVQRIRGASHLRLDARQQVSWHRDYWDAAEELYETIPVLGSLMRWLKRRAAA